MTYDIKRGEEASEEGVTGNGSMSEMVVADNMQIIHENI